MRTYVLYLNYVMGFTFATSRASPTPPNPILRLLWLLSRSTCLVTCTPENRSTSQVSLPIRCELSTIQGSNPAVWLSNHQPADSGQLRPAETAVELESGKEMSWTRDSDAVQAVFVYKLDLNAGNGAFQGEPVFIKAYPGKLVTIQN